MEVFYYTASTEKKSGSTFRHEGTLRGAIVRATSYALKEFERDERGNGPVITVVDAKTGKRVVEDRL